MRFIRYHGVALESARGSEPSLAERIAGSAIHGSWWAHAKGQEIYLITQRIRRSRAILVCALAEGRVTYIHQRLWPHFIRLAGRFPQGSLDQIREIHMPSGRHGRHDVPFPLWVPTKVMEVAKSTSTKEAVSKIEVWLERYGVA